MAKFFKKIREKIITENRSVIFNTNYFKYALGEIVLVVVGILIALQINNWNANRKLQAQEFEILSGIQSDLESGKNELEMGIKYSNLLKNRTRNLARYIAEDLPYSTDLDSTFARLSNWFSPYFSYSSYETLKIKGVNIIQNKDIRERIVVMYERNLPFITEDADKLQWVYLQSVILPLMNKHVEKKMTYGLAQPNDFEQLKDNVEFHNMISYMGFYYEQMERMYTHFDTTLATLLFDIETELASL